VRDVALYCQRNYMGWGNLPKQGCSKVLIDILKGVIVCFRELK